MSKPELKDQPKVPPDFVDAVRSFIPYSTVEERMKIIEDLAPDGITYRQYAAAVITAAFITGEEGWNDKHICACAVRLTDALIEELEKPH